MWFKVTGTHSVFLTGNYIEPVGTGYDDEDDEDSEEDDDDLMDYDLEPDEDELDELDDLADPRIMELEEEEDDDADAEEVPALVAAKDKKGKKRAADEADGLDAMIADDVKEPQLSKKQQKKLKKNDGTAATANGEAKSDKKVAFAKEIEQGPTPSKNAPAASKSNSKSLSIKTIDGVECDDRKLGTGPGAKKGDRVSMRYIGKLKDGKVFDANKSGKPFTFKLGSGEVIKGWDIGVAGMGVGAERRITIPARHAYGSKAQAGIPANSTLIFDVKVVEIKK